MRSSISRWFFEDRLAPLTQAEVDAADAHQHHVEAHNEETEAAEIQGAHERAGAPDAPLSSSETHVDETANTPSSVISTEPVKKPRTKKKSEDGE
jgi:ubiquinol-cytochrome c reductase cytochrome b subunit